MKNLHYRPATEKDLPFLAQVYQQNIVALHGAIRSLEDWKSLLSRENHTYYIVSTEEPVAWFRMDTEEEMELGMVQVAPDRHRQGIGKYIQFLHTAHKQNTNKCAEDHNTFQRQVDDTAALSENAGQSHDHQRNGIQKCLLNNKCH